MTEQTDGVSGLVEWRRAFDDLDHTPWPGTRRINDPSQLRGRKRDVSAIAVTCLANDLVVLHGASGVGKSSLLMAGLKPELERRRKIVVVCTQWDTSDDSVQPSAHVAGFTLDSDPFALPAAEFEANYGDRLVVILDQFEEAIRNNASFAQRVLRWIEDVAGATSAKFIISLRSEHEHELAGLYTKPFARRERVEIPPITDSRIIDLIIAGRRDKDGSPELPIEDLAVEALCDVWQELQADKSSSRWDRPGLLHLQAALYVLWMRRETKSGGPLGKGFIALSDVLALADDASRTTADRGESSRGEMLAYALEVSVSSKVENCERACEATGMWQGVPLAVVDQTRWIFRDIASHLSSGGYKTPRDMWELAGEVIGRFDSDAHRAVAPIVRSLYNGRDRDWLGVARADFDSELCSRGDVSRRLGSGPAAGLPDNEVMFELFRCFFFALEWLRSANIAQLEAKRASRMIVLTHDRYSAGLLKWREGQSGGFEEAVGRFAAHRGQDLEGLVIGQHAATRLWRRLVANVNWRSCGVRDTNFSGVTFVNCDFSGSTFEGCAFNGTTFVNCVLDQVDFVRCQIEGRPGWPKKSILDELPGRSIEEPPEFRLEVSKDLLSSLSALAPTGSVSVSAATHHLHARESGTPAVMALGPAPKPNPVEHPVLPSRPGGLTVCGGRLSSLTFRRCEFVDSRSTVSLRHIAGTSLEICEQSSGTFDIFAAGIRGLTVTRPVKDVEAREGDERDKSTRPTVEGTFTISVHRARVINTWFGVGLDGEATFDDCLLFQLVNASKSFKPTITRSKFLGLVNTGKPKDFGKPTGSIDVPDAGLESLGDLGPDLEGLSVNIDFRESVPGSAIGSMET